MDFFLVYFSRSDITFLTVLCRGERGRTWTAWMTYTGRAKELRGPTRTNEPAEAAEALLALTRV